MFFGLFRRSKIEDWEIQLLKQVLKLLPSEYSRYIQQIDDGLITRVILEASDIPEYNSFCYRDDVFRKYEKGKAASFKINDVKVYDKKTSKFLSFEIYFGFDVINGYALHGSKKPKLDFNRIDVSNFKTVFLDQDTPDFIQIKKLLNMEELKLVNPSEVYSVEIDGKEYFHLLDLEDGDFIGMDDKKMVYKITHDPMGIHVIDKELSEILKGF